MMEFLELIICDEIMTEVYPRVKTLSEQSFLALLATMTDQYASDHNMTADETFSILEQLADIQKMVHRDLGAMPTTA